MRLASVAAGLVFLASACGGSGSPAEAPDGGGGGADADTSSRYFELAVGASWTYQVTDLGNGSSATKSQTVEAFEDIGGTKAGTMAFRLRTEKAGGYTISWQEDTGDAIVRHREQSYATGDVLEAEEVYAPSKLRLDETAAHLAASASFTDDYVETATDYTMGGLVTTANKSEDWTVEAVDESVTVPAGTFSCIRLHRFNGGTGSDKRFWYARGVGKVKEEGSGQNETLTDYAQP